VSSADQAIPPRGQIPQLQPQAYGKGLYLITRISDDAECATEVKDRTDKGKAVVSAMKKTYMK